MPRSARVQEVIPPDITVSVSTTDTTPAGSDQLEVDGGPSRGQITMTTAELAGLKTLSDALTIKVRAAVLP